MRAAHLPNSSCADDNDHCNPVAVTHALPQMGTMATLQSLRYRRWEVSGENTGGHQRKKEEGFGKIEERYNAKLCNNMGVRLLRAVAKESRDDRGEKRCMFGRKDGPEMLECCAANKGVGGQRA